MRNTKLAVIGICVAAATGGMIFSELNLAMESIKHALHASVLQLQWIINIYGIVVCSTLVLFGRAGDVFGRKRIFLVSLIILAISMLGTGLATSMPVVIASQLLNGLASAIIMPISQALITNIYPEERRSKAVGLWAASVGIALGVGPLYAGFIIHFISWRWVFLLNVPIILISFVLILISCPNSKSNDTEAKLDVFGSLTLMAAMACFVMAIVQAGSWHLRSILMLFSCSIALFIALFFIEGRVKQPIIREELFKNRSFVLASFCNCLLLFFIWAGFFLMPLYIQSIFHYSPFETGLIMMLVTLPLIVFSFFSELTYARFGPKRLISLGFVFLALSSGIQVLFVWHAGVAMLVIAALAFGCAWGLIWNPSATKAISTLPQSDAGIASGTFVTFQEVGGTMGLAITASIVRAYPHLAAGYTRGMIVLVMASILGFVASRQLKAN